MHETLTDSAPQPRPITVHLHAPVSAQSPAPAWLIYVFGVATGILAELLAFAGLYALQRLLHH